LKERPDLVLVFGDTNSTLAGALTAAKLHIPIAHVEAGLRSFNKEMPEEINRVLTDHVSDLLFCPTPTAVKNLKAEGIESGIHLTGDVMLDACLAGARVAEKKSRILEDLSLEPEGYYLVTVHRQENTDNPGNLRRILGALNRLDKPVIFPVHPRTRKAIAGIKRGSAAGRGSGRKKKNVCEEYGRIRFIKPLGYLDMLKLEKNAGKILTDSGGVQKEAYFFKRPCITLRRETEWVETLEGGWNVLTGTDTEKIVKQAKNPFAFPGQKKLFGKGDAGRRICLLLK
jgi:UDP-GlcNAc3NAcA epimerase